jgi:U3 small nucleolar RNA-associated protein 19
MTSMLINSKVIETLVDSIVSALDDDVHTDDHVQSLLNAHRLFMSFHEDGTLAAGRRHKRNTNIKNESNATLASYQMWVAGQYRLFLTACIEWLDFDDHSRCQVTALRCLLKHCAPPSVSHLDEALLGKTIVALMSEGPTNIELLAVLLSEVVFKYGDVALVTLRSLRRSLLRRDQRQDGGLNDMAAEDVENNGDDDEGDALQDQIDTAHNVHAVLSRMPMPPSSEVLSTSIVSSRNGARGEIAPAWSDASVHKKAYSACWSALLSTPNLPKPTYVKMLSQIPTMLLPHMINPLTLSDFLADSYALGGEASLLALDGLYYLMRHHQFDCPQFYTKLYALLEPSAFHSVYRERLFEKISLFLKSTGLSTHVISAFVKRTARICLHAPPDGILYALPLIFRLIVKHPTCAMLLHRDSEAGSGMREDVVSEDEQDEQDEDEIMVDVSGMSDEDATRWRGKDTYRPNEANPEKSGALGSSLWEIAALQQHYHPSVATMAKRFNHRLSDSSVVEDFTGQSYDSLFRESMERRVKRVPLEFRRPKNFSLGH